MSSEDLHQHYVCTHAEARALVEGHTEFWVANCGCRDDHGACKRSRHDVCLRFRRNTAGSDTGVRQITREAAEAILAEADQKGLVSRPFRDPADPAQAEGICFCCDCCCYYFQDNEEECDRGAMVAVTDRAACSDCGLCADACYFGARTIGGEGALAVDLDRCYGCGLCVPACPSEAIAMAPRAGQAAADGGGAPR